MADMQPWSMKGYVEWALSIEDPWKVEDVECSEDAFGKETHVHVGVPMGSLVPCPVCGKACRVHDRSDERTWRNEIVFSTKEYIHARIPRADCPEHGVKQIDVPWARPGSRFTLLFETRVLALVMEMPVATVASMLRISEKTVWNITRRYAEEIRSKTDLSSVRRVGVDERSFGNGRDFITIFVDMDTRRAIFATEGKDSETVRRFREHLLAHGGKPHSVTDFSCDFGMAYIGGIRKYFKSARITADRFHLAQMANKALVDVKCDTYKLTVSRLKLNYLLMMKEENMDPEQKAMLASVCEQAEPLGLAFRLKETLMMTYSMGDVIIAKEHLESWIYSAEHSGLRPFRRLAETVRKHLAHILGWFVSKLNNGILEGTNSLINTVKSRSRGFHKISSLIDMVYVVSARRRIDLYGNPRLR